MKHTWKITPADSGQRLDQVLARLADLSKAKARKLIIAGAVYLNGRRIRIASKLVLQNAKIEAYIDPEKLKDGRSQDQVFVMGPQHVLFEDEFLIAVDKPPGLPTQPTLDEARDNLFAAVKKYLGPQAYVGLHHRLDRDTSGVVVFTKKTEANAGTAEMFSAHTARKTYHAIVRGTVPSVPWTVRNFLAKDRSGGKRSRFQSVQSGGDMAKTEFRTLASHAGHHWVEARPVTGRTHQIRVHLSEGGAPILADLTYGGAAGAPRLMLHAVNLTFPHPIHKTEISVSSPLPGDFVTCLKTLKLGPPGS